jgi:hypothetical protein
MDFHTEQILKIINSHLKIKKFLTTLCYFLIIGGLFVYIFYAFSQGNKIKLIKQYQDNKDNFTTEKIMINPRIKFQYNEDEIYDIHAKKAFHKDEQEITLFDVFATGEIGNITSGELKVDEDGTHLVFTKNPVLILKEGKKKAAR